MESIMYESRRRQLLDSLHGSEWNESRCSCKSRGRIHWFPDASRRDVDGMGIISGRYPFGYLLFCCFDGTRKAVKKTCRWEIYVFPLFHSFPLCGKKVQLSGAACQFLQVLDDCYIILIQFATIFYQNNSVFSTFYFCFFRHKPRFSNFPRNVINTIHRFFHRF